MSEPHPIARFFATFVFLALTSVFMYQTASGIGWLDPPVDNAFYPALSPMPQSFAESPSIEATGPMDQVQSDIEVARLDHEPG